MSDEKPVTIDFHVRSFWKIAKTQNDVESPQVGCCRGFFYRLLIHPRGTEDTDPECSHLSVFLEAVKQDWYPDDWIFPNVRFELTVVNFRDPKQSITSWAHWSFSNDATSRGWQKMVHHSRLTKQAGFLNDEGTVLIRGKAEPPYSMLWSKSPLYRPSKLWDVIPPHSPAKQAASPVEQLYSNTSALATGPSMDVVIPSVRSSLGLDSLVVLIHSLFHIKEFRREIYLWQPPEGSQLAEDVFLNRYVHSVEADVEEILSVYPTQKSQYLPPVSHSYRPISVIRALQKLFAKMQLWPVVASLLANSSKSGKASNLEGINKMHLFDLLNKPFSKIIASGIDESVGEEQSGTSHSNLLAPSDNLFTSSQPNNLSMNIQQNPSLQGLLTTLTFTLQPSCHELLRALGLSSPDSASDNSVDSLSKLHELLFTAIMKEARIGRAPAQPTDLSDLASRLMKLNPMDPDSVGYVEESSLDNTSRILFSPFYDCLGEDVGSYHQAFLKIKHVHSVQRSLEETVNACPPVNGKKMYRYPEVLFVYTNSQRNAKKGELFDVPLRMDIASLLEAQAFIPPNSSNRSSQTAPPANQGPVISVNSTASSTEGNLAKENDSKSVMNLVNSAFAGLGGGAKTLFPKDAFQNSQLRRAIESKSTSSVHHQYSVIESKDNLKIRKTNKRARMSISLDDCQCPVITPSSLSSSVAEDDLEEDDMDCDECDITNESDYETEEELEELADAFSQNDGSETSSNEREPHVDETTAKAGSLGDFPQDVPVREKWYSLMAIFLREYPENNQGNSSGGNTRDINTNNGSFSNDHYSYLLLRPEEEGPWFRISNDRVEVLHPRVDFTEWKCHRDFYCAGAVYVAEDYIDSIAAGEVDVDVNLTKLNPKLIFETLAEMGCISVFDGEGNFHVCEPSEAHCAMNALCSCCSVAMDDCQNVENSSKEKNGFQFTRTDDKRTSIFESTESLFARERMGEFKKPNSSQTTTDLKSLNKPIESLRVEDVYAKTSSVVEQGAKAIKQESSSITTTATAENTASINSQSVAGDSINPSLRNNGRYNSFFCDVLSSNFESVIYQTGMGRDPKQNLIHTVTEDDLYLNCLEPGRLQFSESPLWQLAKISSPSKASVTLAILLRRGEENIIKRYVTSMLLECLPIVYAALGEDSSTHFLMNTTPHVECPSSYCSIDCTMARLASDLFPYNEHAARYPRARYMLEQLLEILCNHMVSIRDESLLFCTSFLRQKENLHGIAAALSVTSKKDIFGFDYHEAQRDGVIGNSNNGASSSDSLASIYPNENDIARECQSESSVSDNLINQRSSGKEVEANADLFQAHDSMNPSIPSLGIEQEELPEKSEPKVYTSDGVPIAKGIPYVPSSPLSSSSSSHHDSHKSNPVLLLTEKMTIFANECARMAVLETNNAVPSLNLTNAVKILWDAAMVCWERMIFFSPINLHDVNGHDSDSDASEILYPDFHNRERDLKYIDSIGIRIVDAICSAVLLVVQWSYEDTVAVLENRRSRSPPLIFGYPSPWVTSLHAKSNQTSAIQQQGQQVIESSVALAAAYLSEFLTNRDLDPLELKGIDELRTLAHSDSRVVFSLSLAREIFNKKRTSFLTALEGCNIEENNDILRIHQLQLNQYFVNRMQRSNKGEKTQREANDVENLFKSRGVNVASWNKNFHKKYSNTILGKFSTVSSLITSPALSLYWHRSRAGWPLVKKDEQSCSFILHMPMLKRSDILGYCAPLSDYLFLLLSGFHHWLSQFSALSRLSGDIKKLYNKIPYYYSDPIYKAICNNPNIQSPNFPSDVLLLMLKLQSPKALGNASQILFKRGIPPKNPLNWIMGQHCLGDMLGNFYLNQTALYAIDPECFASPHSIPSSMYMSVWVLLDSDLSGLVGFSMESRLAEGDEITKLHMQIHPDYTPSHISYGNVRSPVGGTNGSNNSINDPSMKQLKGQSRPCFTNRTSHVGSFSLSDASKMQRLIFVRRNVPSGRIIAGLRTYALHYVESILKYSPLYLRLEFPGFGGQVTAANSQSVNRTERRAAKKATKKTMEQVTSVDPIETPGGILPAHLKDVIHNIWPYALKQDNDPTRKGRRRFSLINPRDVFDSFCEDHTISSFVPPRNLVPSLPAYCSFSLIAEPAPEAIIMLTSPPALPMPLFPQIAGSSAVVSGTAGAEKNAVPSGYVDPMQLSNSALTTIDEQHPLLILKWFSRQLCEPVCLGAVVCDGRLSLNRYIDDWMLPRIRALCPSESIFFSKAIVRWRAKQAFSIPNKKNVVSSPSAICEFLNLKLYEEISIRSVQPIRRLATSIKKINRRTGDVIIAHLESRVSLATPTAISTPGISPSAFTHPPVSSSGISSSFSPVGNSFGNNNSLPQQSAQTSCIASTSGASPVNLVPTSVSRNITVVNKGNASGANDKSKLIALNHKLIYALDKGAQETTMEREISDDNSELQGTVPVEGKQKWKNHLELNVDTLKNLQSFMLKAQISSVIDSATDKTLLDNINEPKTSISQGDQLIGDEKDDSGAVSAPAGPTATKAAKKKGGKTQQIVAHKRGTLFREIQEQKRREKEEERIEFLKKEQEKKDKEVEREREKLEKKKRESETEKKQSIKASVELLQTDPASSQNQNTAKNPPPNKAQPKVAKKTSPITPVVPSPSPIKKTAELPLQVLPDLEKPLEKVENALTQANEDNQPGEYMLIDFWTDIDTSKHSILCYLPISYRLLSCIILRMRKGFNLTHAYDSSLIALSDPDSFQNILPKTVLQNCESVLDDLDNPVTLTPQYFILAKESRLLSIDNYKIDLNELSSVSTAILSLLQEELANNGSEIDLSYVTTFIQNNMEYYTFINNLPVRTSVNVSGEVVKSESTLVKTNLLAYLSMALEVIIRCCCNEDRQKQALTKSLQMEIHSRITDSASTTAHQVQDNTSEEHGKYNMSLTANLKKNVVNSNIDDIYIDTYIYPIKLCVWVVAYALLANLTKLSSHIVTKKSILTISNELIEKSDTINCDFFSGYLAELLLLWKLLGMDIFTKISSDQHNKKIIESLITALQNWVNRGASMKFLKVHHERLVYSVLTEVFGLEGYEINKIDEGSNQKAELEGVEKSLNEIVSPNELKDISSPSRGNNASPSGAPEEASIITSPVVNKIHLAKNYSHSSPAISINNKNAYFSPSVSPSQPLLDQFSRMVLSGVAPSANALGGNANLLGASQIGVINMDNDDPSGIMSIMNPMMITSPPLASCTIPPPPPMLPCTTSSPLSTSPLQMKIAPSSPLRPLTLNSNSILGTIHHHRNGLSASAGPIIPPPPPPLSAMSPSSIFPASSSPSFREAHAPLNYSRIGHNEIEISSSSELHDASITKQEINKQETMLKAMKKMNDGATGLELKNQKKNLSSESLGEKAEAKIPNQIKSEKDIELKKKDESTIDKKEDDASFMYLPPGASFTPIMDKEKCNCIRIRGIKNTLTSKEVRDLMCSFEAGCELGYSYTGNDKNSHRIKIQHMYISIESIEDKKYLCLYLRYSPGIDAVSALIRLEENPAILGRIQNPHIYTHHLFIPMIGNLIG